MTGRSPRPPQKRSKRPRGREQLAEKRRKKKKKRKTKKRFRRKPLMMVEMRGKTGTRRSIFLAPPRTLEAKPLKTKLTHPGSVKLPELRAPLLPPKGEPRS